LKLEAKVYEAMARLRAIEAQGKALAAEKRGLKARLEGDLAIMHLRTLPTKVHQSFDCGCLVVADELWRDCKVAPDMGRIQRQRDSNERAEAEGRKPIYGVVGACLRIQPKRKRKAAWRKVA
jgi:hypothetical protein